MLVTLFSDASICPATGCVGWAAWSKCDRGTARGDGVLRRLTVDSAVAEAMALLNGLALAIRKGLVQPGDTVVTQTDCNSVMGVLQGIATRAVRRAHRDRTDITREELHQEVLRRNEEIDEIAGAYARIVGDMGITVVWRHCKGHRGLDDRRAAVNTDCDERARRNMQAARRRHRPPALAMAA